MAANAIGKVLEAVQAKFPNGLGSVETVFIARATKLAYRIETREDRLPADVVVRFKVDVAGLRAGIERGVSRLSR